MVLLWVGRDSHDIGLSEREMREVHLVPFRHVVRNYDCQSLMMAYSDYMGIPVAGSTELLQQILRQEWDSMVLLSVTVGLLVT